MANLELTFVGWIKNVETDHCALGGSEDVGEAESALVLVPGAKRTSRELALGRAFEEPETKRPVEETNEGHESHPVWIPGSAREEAMERLDGGVVRPSPFSQALR